MKPSETVTTALARIDAVRTDGDLNLVLSNVLLGLMRKEISATDALAAVAVTDGMCNVLNTTIRVMRLKMELEKASGKKVELVEVGQMVFTGEKKP